MKRVVLIGDSIRMGYQPTVERELAGRATVWGPEINGGHSVNVLLHLHLWLREPADVVHVNAGLHDIRTDVYGGRETIVPLAHYRDNVDHILRWLRAHTRATVIWATTTPVDDAAAHANHAQWRDFDRYDADVRACNAAAVEVARAHGVAVNDLYAAAGDPAVERDPDGVHYTAAGSAALGRRVAAAIAEVL